MKKDPIDSLVSWVVKHPNIFGKSLSIVIFTLGILLIIGAIKDWDWLYAPDSHYRNNWTMGQISKFFGRKIARLVGGVFGAFVLLPIGGMIIYGSFIGKR